MSSWSAFLGFSVILMYHEEWFLVSIWHATSSLKLVVLPLSCLDKKKSPGFPINCPRSHRPLSDTDSIAPVTEVFPTTGFVKRILLVVNEKSLCHPSSQQASESLTYAHVSVRVIKLRRYRGEILQVYLTVPGVTVHRGQKKCSSNETSPALNKKLVDIFRKWTSHRHANKDKI